jgi:hypothetical protein
LFKGNDRKLEKIHNEEIHTLSHYKNNKIKEEMGRACSTHGRENNIPKFLLQKLIG